MYDLQVSRMFGNMYTKFVSIDNGPYFVLFRDLTVKYDRSNRRSRICVQNLKTQKNQFTTFWVGIKLNFSSCVIVVYGFWDYQMTTPDLKSTHPSCGWLCIMHARTLVQSLDRTFLYARTPYKCTPAIRTPYEWFIMLIGIHVCIYAYLSDACLTEHREWVWENWELNTEHGTHTHLW